MKPKKTFILAIILITLLTSSITYATLSPLTPPPPGGYNSGSNSILDPGCAPNAVDCFVNLPSSGSVTADNGLTVTGSNVQLGGVLLNNTQIDQNGKDFSVKNDGFEFSSSANFGGFGATGMGIIQQSVGAIFPGANEQSMIGIIRDPSVAGASYPAMYYSNDLGGLGSIERYVNLGDTSVSMANRQNFSGNDYVTQVDLGDDLKIALYSNSLSKSTEINFDNSFNGISFSSELGSYIFPRTDGLANQVLTTDGAGQLSWQNAGGGSGWSLTGNAGTTPGTNFIGTTDTEDLVLKTNSTQNFRLFNVDGSFLIGSQDDLQYASGTENKMFFDMTNQAIRIGAVDDDGWDAVNLGSKSVAIGFPYSADSQSAPLASGDLSFAVGSGAVASGTGSIAIGYNVSATNTSSTAFGIRTVSSGLHSIAFGDRTTASGKDGFSAGYSTDASGDESIALGNNTTASAENTIAWGSHSEASGFAATAGGFYSIASGNTSVAIGNTVTAPSFGETAFGKFNTDYVPVSTIVTNTADRLFTIGNGLVGVESDAFTILKSGETGIGLNNFEANTNGNIFQVGDGSTGIIGYVDNGTGNWMAVSDERKKHNITDITYGLNEILKLKPVSFDYNRNNEHTIGFLAQQVLPIIPEAVSGDEEKGYAMSYSTLTPALVKAIQEMNLKVDLISMNAGNASSSIFDSLKNWLGDASNGITDFFAQRGHFKELCIGENGNETCLTKDQVDQLLNQQAVSVPIVPTPDLDITDPTTNTETIPEPVLDTGSQPETPTGNLTSDPIITE